MLYKEADEMAAVELEEVKLPAGGSMDSGETGEEGGEGEGDKVGVMVKKLPLRRMTTTHRSLPQVATLLSRTHSLTEGHH